MAVFDEQSIQELFDSNLNKAKESLGSLEFCCSDKVSFGGLTGWVFERTIEHCLREELKARGIPPQIEKQVPLEGRAKADMKVGPAVLEVKEKGLFDRNAPDRYGRYARAARSKGNSYLFLALRETHLPYLEDVENALGHQNAFFLFKGKSKEPSGDWQRFIDRILEELKPHNEPNNSQE
jgi:hypothetical protein